MNVFEQARKESNHEILKIFMGEAGKETNIYNKEIISYRKKKVKILKVKKLTYVTEALKVCVGGRHYIWMSYVCHG